MKGEKGVCLVGIGKDQVRRTKFDSEKNAKTACDFHISMNLISKDAVVYKCSACNSWHFGKPEWAKKYGKK